MYVLVFVIILSAAGPAFCMFNGTCASYENRITTVQHFNASLFSGLWYELQHYNTTTGECTTNTIIDNRSNMTLKINSSIGEKNFTLIENSTGSGQIGKYKINAQPDTYWIVDTDYKKFAVAWSCRNINTTTSNQTLWVLGRKTSMDSTTSEHVTKLLAGNGINSTRIVPTNQNNKQCKRKSGTPPTAFPSILGTIMAALFVKML